ncbi:MAG: TolC family protein [Elusimicrobia bacterium]|nr:TolC family protein [Elusimicrobiota bacterium]
MRTLFAALCVLLPAAASGAEPAMRWEECVSIALKSNPDLAASRLSRDAARAGYLGSYSALLPSLSLSNSVSESDGSRKQSWTAQGSLGIDLFNMGSYASVRSNSASLSQAEAQLRLKSAELRASLAKAFANLLYAQTSVPVADRIQAVRRSNAELVSLRYDSGRESKGNMLRAKADLSSARADAAAARRELRTSRIALNRLLGMGDDAVYAATGTWASGAVPPEPSPALLEGHPRLASLEASIASARAGVASSQANLWPTLSASYARDWQDDRFFPHEPGWSASGSLSYRLMSGGPTQTYYAVQRARRNLDGAKEDLRAGQSALRSSLETAWSNLASTVSDVEVGAESLEASRQRNDEASVRYASGLMNFENWQTVVTEFVQSEKNYIRSLRDLASSRADWENALGKPLEVP